MKRFMGINGRDLYADCRQEFESLRVGNLVTVQELDGVELRQLKYALAAEKVVVVGFTDTEFVILQIDDSFCVKTSIDDFQILNLCRVVGYDVNYAAQNIDTLDEYYCEKCSTVFTPGTVVCVQCGDRLPNELPDIKWRFKMLEIE